MGGDVDHRSDIWALGAVLYEMITGNAAFDDDNSVAIPYRISNEEPVSILSLRPEVPDRLVKIVERALEKDPAERYGSMQELRADLEKVLLVAPGSDPPEPANPAKGSRIGRYLLVVGLLVVAATLGGIFRADRKSTRLNSSHAD